MFILIHFVSTYSIILWIKKVSLFTDETLTENKKTWMSCERREVSSNLEVLVELGILHGTSVSCFPSLGPALVPLVTSFPHEGLLEISPAAEFNFFLHF